MKTFLVTGAAGFIGSEVVRQYLKQGHRVIGLDNLNDYYSVSLKKSRIESLIHKNFTFSKVDIEDRAELEKVFKQYKFDAILNLAARAGVRYSMENPYVYMTTNANATLNLLDLAKDHGIKKFVLASTSSLYAGQEMPFDEELAVNTPISPYAASKKAAEAMAHSYHYLYGIDISIVRYFTVYGPSGRPDMCIFRFIKWIDQEQPIELFGDGTQSRDFTYVEDIARGTILAAEKEVGFEVINLGGGMEPVNLLQVIEMLEKHIGKKANINNKTFHKADIKSTSASIHKAKRLLGWEPETTFEDGIKKTVEWYFKNHELCKNVEL